LVDAVLGHLGGARVGRRIGVVAVVSAVLVRVEAVSVGVEQVVAVAVLVDAVLGHLLGARVGVWVGVVAVVAVVAEGGAHVPVGVAVEALVHLVIAVVVDAIADLVGPRKDPVVIVITVFVRERPVVVGVDAVRAIPCAIGAVRPVAPVGPVGPVAAPSALTLVAAGNGEHTSDRQQNYPAGRHVGLLSPARLSRMRPEY
jgi:hypothetical protein